MTLTKLGHCCLIIEDQGLRILTDPGEYTILQNQVKDIDLILITHEHADPVRRSENHTLQPGTAAWSTFGQTPAPASPATTDDESDDA